MSADVPSTPQERSNCSASASSKPGNFSGGVTPGIGNPAGFSNTLGMRRELIRIFDGLAEARARSRSVVLPRFNGQVVKPPAYTTIDTMNRQRRRFTTEQKAEAVGLCLRENLSILEASKRLGVHASCLGRWVKQAQIDQGGLKDSGPLTSDERIEFTRLRKENRELRREKDFFRLAAAHFAKEQLSQRGFQ
jgi:transposase-like protein